MNALKEKLKKLGSGLAAAANWVGSNLGAALTIFSVVIGFLFIRERKKSQSLQTDLQLKDSQVKVKNAKQKAKEAEDEYEEANKKSASSYAEYIRARAAFEEDDEGK